MMLIVHGGENGHKINPEVCALPERPNTYSDKALFVSLKPEV